MQKQISIKEAITEITGEPDFWKKFLLEYGSVSEFAVFRDECKKKLGFYPHFCGDMIIIEKKFVVDPLKLDKQLKRDYPSFNIA